MLSPLKARLWKLSYYVCNSCSVPEGPVEGRLTLLHSTWLRRYQEGCPGRKNSLCRP